MGQVHRFSEAATVHLGACNGQDQCQQREQCKEGERDPGDGTAPDTGHEGGAEQGFDQGEGHTGRLCDPVQERQMEKLEITVHHQAGAYGIQQFEQARHQERDADQDGGQPLHSRRLRLHLV